MICRWPLTIEPLHSGNSQANACKIIDAAGLDLLECIGRFHGLIMVATTIHVRDGDKLLGIPFIIV